MFLIYGSKITAASRGFPATARLSCLFCDSYFSVINRKFEIISPNFYWIWLRFTNFIVLKDVQTSSFFHKQQFNCEWNFMNCCLILPGWYCKSAKTKDITDLYESTTEITLPDVYIRVLDHTPSSHFHRNDLCSHMQKNSTRTTITTKLHHNCRKITNIQCQSYTVQLQLHQLDRQISEIYIAQYHAYIYWVCTAGCTNIARIVSS